MQEPGRQTPPRDCEGSPVSAPPRHHARLRIAAVIAALAALLVVFVIVPFGLWFKDRGELIEFVQRQGAWGPLVVIGLQAVQVLMIPVPGQIVSLASGFLFGVWRGTLYSAIGMAIGSATLLVLVRELARPIVARWISPGLLQRADRWAKTHGPIFFFLVFLLPFMPDNVACLAAGLTSIPITLLLLLIVVGRLPGQIGASWLGARAQSLSAEMMILFGAITLLVLAAGWKYREKLHGRLLAWAEFVDRRRKK